MIHLLVFTLAIFAVCYIAGFSKISLPLRARLDRPGTRSWVLALLECPGCLGFHLGWGVFLLHLTPSVLSSWWISGLYCCASSLLLARHAGLSE